MPHPERLYTLGPEGTFSDQAARRLREQLGAPALPIVYTRTMPEVQARTDADGSAWGVFPIENSDAGTVIPAQDGLVKYRLTILWELSLRVRFSLLARGEPSAAQTLHVHPVAFDQCNEYVSAHLPQARVAFTHSNGESARIFLDAPADEPLAAIVTLETGEAQPRYLVRADIQNFAHNTTRFLVVRRRREPEAFDFARHKTSVYVEPAEDRPGLLHGLLSIFNAHALNLCRLESRPDKVTPWKYVFFIDFNNNPGSEQCVEELRRTGHRITVLGSYDALE